MDLASVISIVGSLGFPIAACVWLAMVFKKSIDANTTASQSLILSNKTIVDTNSAIKDVLEQICQKLNMIDTIPKG